MFSSYMVHDNMDLEAALAPIVSNVIIAKNNDGKAYLVEWNFNCVGDMIVGQGYQIKTNAEVTLNLTGSYATPEDHSINLVAGWNMIGYLGFSLIPTIWQNLCRCISHLKTNTYILK